MPNSCRISFLLLTSKFSNRKKNPIFHSTGEMFSQDKNLFMSQVCVSFLISLSKHKKNDEPEKKTENKKKTFFGETGENATSFHHQKATFSFLFVQRSSQDLLRKCDTEMGRSKIVFFLSREA
jgi:hypothetical protein